MTSLAKVTSIVAAFALSACVQSETKIAQITYGPVGGAHVYRFSDITEEQLPELLREIKGRGYRHAILASDLKLVPESSDAVKAEFKREQINLIHFWVPSGGREGAYDHMWRATVIGPDPRVSSVLLQ